MSSSEEKINSEEKKNKDEISTSNPSLNFKIGTKRIKSPSKSPSISNGHLVYVRRKLETEKNEQGKIVSNNSNINKEEIVIKDQKKEKNDVEKEQGEMINCDNWKGEMVIKERNEEKEENEKGKLIDSSIGKDEIVMEDRNEKDMENVENQRNEENVEKNEESVDKTEKKVEEKEKTYVEKEKNVENIEKNDVEKEKNVEKNEIIVERNEKNVEKSEKNETKEEWKERFLRLQVFLKNLDQSNQEDYMRMLRSLSAVGRSKHAVELEKRAIHLLLEEGKELHRMKVLDVLGCNSERETEK